MLEQYSKSPVPSRYAIAGREPTFRLNTQSVLGKRCFSYTLTRHNLLLVDSKFLHGVKKATEDVV